MGDAKDDDLFRSKLRNLMSDKKELPPRLENELKPTKYKPRLVPKVNPPMIIADSSVPLSRVFDDSIERAMYDEMVGPILKSRPTSSSSSSSSSSSKKYLKPLEEIAHISAADKNNPIENIDFTTSILKRLSSKIP